MRLALYQPDIPQNTGTILRLAACLEVAVDIIGPAGFDMSDRNLRRSGLDYLAHVCLTRHLSWESYLDERKASAHATPSGRIVLLSSKAACAYTAFVFEPSDTLLLGRESAGVPDHVRDAADAAVRIPIKPPLRSLNVAVAAAMVLGEALRQTGAGPAGFRPG
jgi:tRNA (cytidine/uridine-2'-O-)-methyltransferase